MTPEEHRERFIKVSALAREIVANCMVLDKQKHQLTNRSATLAVDNAWALASEFYNVEHFNASSWDLENKKLTPKDK